jgi:hypothetical protein
VESTERAYIEKLERRVTRLRKAIVWLHGALHYHEDNPGHHDSAEECTVWECQRARAVLEEEAEK